MEREDCLEFLNFIFYWNSLQHRATDPLASGETWFLIHQHSPPAPKRVCLPSVSPGLGVQSSVRVHRHRGGRVAPDTHPILTPAASKTSCFLISENTVKHSPMPGFPGDANGKEPVCQAGNIRETSSIPGLGRSPGRGHGNPLRYSCLESPMDRGARQTAVSGVTKSQTQLK